MVLLIFDCRTPSETNIKTDTESSSVEIQNVVRNAEIIKVGMVMLNGYFFNSQFCRLRH